MANGWRIEVSPSDHGSLVGQSLVDLASGSCREYQEAKCCAVAALPLLDNPGLGFQQC